MTYACVLSSACSCRSPYGIVPGGAPPAEQIGGMGSTGFGENHILLFTIFNPLYPITVVGTPNAFSPIIIVTMSLSYGLHVHGRVKKLVCQLVDHLVS